MGLLIRERTAEEIKINIGSGYRLNEPRTIEVKEETWLRAAQEHRRG